MFRRILSVIAFLCMVGTDLSAQSITGRISGTVVDGQGGVLPGISVKFINDATRGERVTLTDSNGFYTVTNLPVGEYRIAIEHPGFKKSTKTGYSLTADARLTVNFSLEIGDVSEVVEVVAASGATVNTTSGEIERVIDQSQVQDLALNGRNYMQLTTLIPGVPLMNDDQLELMTGLSVSQPVNGNRGNANLLTIDGGFNLDSGSNGSQINNVGIDFVREVSIKTSNFSAEYGRNSGASINVVTRNGGNKFHGSLFEYLRNDKLDANNYFNNNSNRVRPPLRYNNFGYSFGGPIIKDKFFFFGGMEWKYIRRFTNASRQTIPTRAERLGDFSYRLRGPDGKVGTPDDGVLRDPSKDASKCTAPTIKDGAVTKAAVRDNCFGGKSLTDRNIIPLSRITADGKAIASVYSAMEQVAISYSDTPSGNNVTFSERNAFDFRQDMLRLDYKFNDKQSIYGRYIHDAYDLIAPFGTFVDADLPTIPTNRIRPGYSVQIGHTWMMRPNLINETKISTAWNSQRVLPVGDRWKRSTYGFTFDQFYIGGGPYEESIPNISVNGFASIEGANRSLLSPTTDISFTDNLSVISGAHVLKTGLMIIRNRKDQNGRSVYPGSVAFNNSQNPNSSNLPFADALLGNYRTYSEGEIDSYGLFRFSQFETYVNDTWRALRNLSLDVGVRYAWFNPIYTQSDNLVNFVPGLYDPSKAVTVNKDGTIDMTKGGNKYNGLVRAGEGIPANELGRVPNGDSSIVLSVPAGAPRGLYDAKHLIAPRFGFAYAPAKNDKFAIRGGFGIFYDRSEGNITFSSVNIPPYGNSAQYENGNIATVAKNKSTPTFADIFIIDPNLDVPYTMSYSLSIQRELPMGITGEIAYVGNQGRHLLRQPDINQPTYADLLANQKLPALQRASTNFLRPYKGYSAIRQRISDSNSNYNSFQFYATKRKGIVSATVSYTWSKVLSDSSGNGDNPEDPFNRGYNYGPTGFDRRHIFITTYMLRLPFFKKSNALLKNAFGGWELSGVTRFQTGRYLTPIVSGIGIPGNRRADSTGENIEGPQTIDEWFNKAAFVRPPDEQRGIAGSGIIQGPGRDIWDLSLRKNFSLSERVKLRFQADFFNAWNTVNLNDPNVTVTNSSYGQIGGAAPGRNIQFGMRLSF